jgi:ribosome recycling factor
MISHREAILESDLGIKPSNDARSCASWFRTHRGAPQDLCKQVKMMVEEGKVRCAHAQGHHGAVKKMKKNARLQRTT